MNRIMSNKVALNKITPNTTMKNRSSYESPGGASMFKKVAGTFIRSITAITVAAITISTVAMWISVSIAEVKARYGVDVWARYGEALQTFVGGGWLIYDGDTLRLSRAGMLVAHDVMAVFVA